MEEAVNDCTTCGCPVPTYDKWDVGGFWYTVRPAAHGTLEHCVAALTERIERLEAHVHGPSGDDE
jgi:hypothetical protein